MMDEAEKTRREARALRLLALASKLDTRVETTPSTARAWALALGGRDYDALELAVIEHYQTSTYPLMVAHLTRKVREPNSHPYNPENVTHVRLARDYNSRQSVSLPQAEAYRAAMGELLKDRGKAISGPAQVAAASREFRPELFR